MIMTDRDDSSKTKQIKTIIGVLGSGIVAGVLIALAFLYYYNPSGSYLAQHVLLDPQNAFTLKFVERGIKPKSEGRYVFEAMTFTFFDSLSKQRKVVPVSKNQYAQFYQLVAHDKSVSDPTGRLSNQQNQAVLALKVRALGDDSSHGMEQTFSEIDFIQDGDYYRIQLRQSGPGSDWIWFYHPHIYQEVLKMFGLL
jgi:hypothetical protein